MESLIVIVIITVVITAWITNVYFTRSKDKPQQVQVNYINKPVLVATKIEPVPASNGIVVRYGLYLVFSTGELFIAANSDIEPLEAIETEIKKELGL